MVKIVIGLVCVMVSNILLGTSLAKLKENFNKEKMLKGILKCVLIIVSVCLMYLCGYLNPEIMVANINGQEVNLASGMEFLFVAGIITYGMQSLIKLKDLMQLKTSVDKKGE